MNSRSGTTPFCIACSSEMRPFMKGSNASSLILPITGDMVNTVSRSASPISTILGGVSCMPMACLSIDSTTMIRVNAVSAITSEGSTLRSVSSTAILMALATCWLPPSPLT